MRKCLVLVTLLLSMTCCNNSSNKLISIKDTTSTLAEDEPEGDSEIGTTLTDIRRDYVSQYDSIVNLDTSFTLNEELYRLRFTHFCLKDSAVTVPVEYNYDISSDFVTHNFKSLLVVIKGQDTLLNQEITKTTFEVFLDPPLVRYGVLMYPNFSIQGNKIRINYSVSIPVTDVGIGVSLEINEKGIVTLKQ